MFRLQDFLLNWLIHVPVYQKKKMTGESVLRVLTVRGSKLPGRTCLYVHGVAESFSESVFLRFLKLSAGYDFWLYYKYK